MGEQPAQPEWTKELESREWSQVLHAIVYARDHSGAGAPGHGQFMLIAKLAKLLDLHYTYIPEKPRVITVAWNETCKCWRDLMTGIRVELED